MFVQFLALAVAHVLLQNRIAFCIGLVAGPRPSALVVKGSKWLDELEGCRRKLSQSAFICHIPSLLRTG